MTNALDSRTIRTLLVAALSYSFIKYAVPGAFGSEMVKGAIADFIVYGAFATAAWYRKNVRVHIDQWFGRRDV